MEQDPFFDLSVVIDPEVETALAGLLTEWRMRKRWDDFPPPTRRMHQHILRTYLRTGRAPMRDSLKQIVPDDPQSILADLVERDLVFLDQDEIAGAYPFSSQPTRHAVTIGGQRIAAVCAIDALGAGAMARAAAHVSTSCPVCEARIEVTTGDKGLTLQAVSPATAVLWAGVEPIGGCAAATQCQSMLLFCSDDHLQGWCASRPGPKDGYRLTPQQALQAGAAIFRPFLAEPRPDATPS